MAPFYEGKAPVVATQWRRRLGSVGNVFALVVMLGSLIALTSLIVIEAVSPLFGMLALMLALLLVQHIQVRRAAMRAEWMDARWIGEWDLVHRRLDGLVHSLGCLGEIVQGGSAGRLATDEAVHNLRSEKEALGQRAVIAEKQNHGLRQEIARLKGDLKETDRQLETALAQALTAHAGNGHEGNGHEGNGHEARELLRRLDEACRELGSSEETGRQLKAQLDRAKLELHARDVEDRAAQA